jgi:hypothetical protein
MAEIQRWQQQQMAELLQYMQSLGQHTGLPPPPTLFVTPPRPPLEHATPVSMSIFV